MSVDLAAAGVGRADRSNCVASDHLFVASQSVAGCFIYFCFCYLGAVAAPNAVAVSVEIVITISIVKLLA